MEFRFHKARSFFGKSVFDLRVYLTSDCETCLWRLFPFATFIPHFQYRAYSEVQIYAPRVCVKLSLEQSGVM